MNEKILSYYQDALSIKNGNTPIPRMAMIYPTYVCNFGCPHCMYRNMKRTQNYPYQELENLISELKRLGTKGIVFCGGGEPTLYPHIQKIVEYIASNCMDFGILTNGSMLDKYGKLLVDNSKFIRISVDSVDKDNYKKIHCPPPKYTLGHTLDIIKSLLQYRDKSKSKCSIGIKTLLSKNNIIEKTTIETVFHSMGVDYIQFKYARGCRNGMTEHKSKLLSPCFMSPIQTMIDAYGDVYICCFYQYRRKSHKLGNTLYRSFHNIWYSKKHDEVIKRIKLGECNVYDCKLHEYNNVMNDILTKDPCHINFY